MDWLTSFEVNFRQTFLKALRLEMFKMNQKSAEGATEVVIGDQGKSTSGALRVMTPSIRGKSPVCPDQSHSNFSSDSGKINLRRSKLECPRFDGSNFLGWKLKVE